MAEMQDTEIAGYVSRECDRCGGSGERFDITNSGNASGTVNPTGATRCTCISGRIYTSAESIAIRTEIDTRGAAARQAVEVDPSIPDWML